MNNFPIVHINKVYHIGRIDNSRKRKNSYEGSGLSISNHPNAWLKISDRDLESSLYEFVKNDASFLDFHELNAVLVDEMTKWGLEMGYILCATLYRYTFWHGDLDEEASILFQTYEEALEESNKDEEAIEQIDGFIATEKMNKKVFGEPSPIDVIDLLSTLFAEHVLKIDGVWWDDDLDISALSAPRGVIFNSKLQEWTRTERDFNEVEYEEEY
ncbi:hypothetical protein PP175_29180 (plasmid) [Aneurinibacillus sp. Ricciae_BoGa-3]|uniref:hypothetical protein n=1 Tax=Aneurinibacillus sp. Ricciae_BoGa-3 TaxID=3022697 RepID=UPI0023417FB2|nr:hypothetical protein [Aneurinibacillus sp. Ricciae_BoGa-3]WCK57266.1 hypothetical protein PP175_29180 [Aneurinibacillus sp. Ricciae_BoGa-3]